MSYNMLDLYYILDTLPYNTQQMLLCLNDIARSVWIYDIPIRHILEHLRNNRLATFPKRHRRWRNYFRATYGTIVVKVPSFYHIPQEYSIRKCQDGTTKVILHPDTEELMQRLLLMDILRRGVRKYYINWFSKYL